MPRRLPFIYRERLLACIEFSYVHQQMYRYEIFTVSKKHAEIEANSHETASWICDLNSSNKTKLNNSILRPNRCYELKSGDVLEFGMVRAVFKVSLPLDDSLIPETPALNRQKTQQRVIPGTPDSSLNNSSTNVSLIPATQDERKKSVFRHPSLPLRTSTTSIRKSSVQNSSIDDQDNSQSFGVEKQNVGESKISIYDMETQNFSCNSYNETNIDIHDAESKKNCILNSIKNLTKSVDMGKQSKIGAPEEVTDIHDIETQHDINFHDIETAKNINIHNLKTRDNKRTLKVMFENTMEERIEDQPQISIQTLENILELSQKSVRNIINEGSEKETENLLVSNSIPTDLSTPKSTIENPTPKSVCKYPSTSKSSVPEDPSTPKSLRQKHLTESKIAKTHQEETNMVKNDNDELKNCVENVGDQESGTSNGEQLQQISKIISEDEDILAGLPDFRISGTLSNPPSPTLSEYRININKNRAKQIKSIKIAPKKRGISRKSSRRTLDHRVVENATHTINEPNSMSTLENSSNSFINNLNADKISVCENDEKKVSEKSKESLKKTKNLYSSKRSDSLLKSTSINSQEKTKQNINDDVFVENRNKKIISGRQSANILDFTVRKNLSNNGKMSEEVNLNKEAIVKVERISLSTPTGSISDTPTESVIENDNKNINRQNRYKNVVNNQITSSTSTKENEKTTQNVEMRRNTRAIKKTKPLADDISSEVGEESQEVEMIMNGALKEQNNNSNIETKKNTQKNARNTRLRSTRKRNSTKNTLSVINTMANKSTKETKRNNKQSTRLSQSQQSVIDSSIIIDSIEKNTKNNRTSLDISKTNSLRDKQQTHTTRKTKNNKQRKKDFIEETSSSETNTSNEITSILSTPNRTRRSMSSSFAMQSPLRIKHKILFTGISSNDYSKLLTKLGASQVDNPTKCTVLVTDKVRRTVKFLCALALSVPIVSVDWLITSEKTGHFIELENYILKDSAAETKFRFKLEESLKKAKEHKLLEGYTLVVTPNVTPPLPELKNIIISCGGKALLRPPSSWPRNSIIISHEEDLTNAKKFLEKAPKTVTVHSTEFLLTGILRQELEFTEFKLI
ncbi:Mediator of DNA damage checkpoint protein 1 [Melipona quadrifasciata]|uniref:Mediator of DNA damage checkpoint protein 1 n=1 Tax=Melipona quadrifasciata TaxID=166423 RepID=A0A0N0BEA1_9HYME|nr:Mediator of DNA damage checkpoint protein 1 [Melipona quadrifasciata]